jgi:hypothetical protein
MGRQFGCYQQLPLRAVIQTPGSQSSSSSTAADRRESRSTPDPNTRPISLNILEHFAMKIMQWLADAIEFVSVGFLEIFSNTDNYPLVGLQPYSGEVFSQWTD